MLSAPSPVGHAASVAWGDVPGWIGAISTMLGLIAAGIAAWYVRGQLIEMRRQTEANGEELDRQRVEWAEADRVRARAQAEQIDIIPELRLADLPSVGSGTYWTATVTNESNRPIRNLQCRANVEGADKPNQLMNNHIGRVADVGNTGERFVKDGDLRAPLPVLRRGEHVTFLSSLPPAPAWLTKFWVQFEDDADLLWQLDSYGHLQRIEPGDWWTY
jgi:hypothetical protein